MHKNAEARIKGDVMNIGVIKALWRYPVSSMRGETVPAADLVASGIVGDRAWAVADRKDATAGLAARGRKWAPLIGASARYLAPPTASTPAPAVEIQLPDQTIVASADSDAHARLSSYLGHEVMLCRMAGAGGAAGDETVAQPAYARSPIHIVTTSSLATLRAALPDIGIDERRFRPNIVVETPEAEGYVENDWIGRTIRVGKATLHIAEPCVRCAMTTLAQADLEKAVGVLQVINDRNNTHLGVYADVVDGGGIEAGDPVVFA